MKNLILKELFDQEEREKLVKDWVYFILDHRGWATKQYVQNNAPDIWEQEDKDYAIWLLSEEGNLYQEVGEDYKPSEDKLIDINGFNIEEYRRGN